MSGAARMTLDRDERIALAGCQRLCAEYLGAYVLAGAEDELASLREAVRDVERLLLLFELVEYGEVIVPEDDVEPLYDWLWDEVTEAHKAARHELDQIPRMRFDVGQWSRIPLEESEAQARETADMHEREAEIYTRLISQLGGFADEEE